MVVFGIEKTVIFIHYSTEKCLAFYTLKKLKMTECGLSVQSSDQHQINEVLFL